MVKVLPLPGMLATFIFPPFASINFLDTANPSPIPRAFVVNRGRKQLAFVIGADPGAVISGSRYGLYFSIASSLW
jgi:hypothetical protein